MNKVFISSKDQAVSHVNALRTSQGFRRKFDFRRQFTIKAGKQGADQIPLPSEGPYEQEGYNIVYTVQSNGTAPAFIRFKSQADGQGQSNDVLPLRSISTPGAVISGQPGIRYGMRPFWHFSESNDELTIEWDGTQLTEDITVDFVATGWLYIGLR